MSLCTCEVLNCTDGGGLPYPHAGDFEDVSAPVLGMMDGFQVFVPD